MPAIEVPAGLPCPQALTASPEESRLLSEGETGPRGARTIEQDERQFQTLSWALGAEQAAVWRTWWREDLIFGGAWFAAPPTWPALEGRVVKVRRFVDEPAWTYRGNGNWLLRITCEARGETLLPTTGGAPLARIWFDDFNGTNNTVLTSHAQDLPLRGSIWEAADFTEPRIGTGGIAKTGTNPIASPWASYAETDFGAGVRLDWGWNFRLIADGTAETSASGGNRDSVITLAMGGSSFIYIRLDFSAREITVSAELSSVPDELVLDLDEHLSEEDGSLNLRIVVNQHNVQVQSSDSNTPIGVLTTEKTRQELLGLSMFIGGDPVTQEKSYFYSLDLWGAVLAEL